MNNLRVVLAIVLSMIILGIWQSYYSKKYMPKQPISQGSTINPPIKPKAPLTENKVIQNLGIQKVSAYSKQEDTVVLGNYYFVISRRGGYVKEIVYKTDKTALVASNFSVYPLSLFYYTEDKKTINDLNLEYTLEKKDSEVILTSELFEKRIIFQGNKFLFKFKYLGEKPGNMFIAVLNNNLKDLQRVYKPKEESVKKLKKIKKTNLLKGIEWFSVMDRYYIQILEPLNNKLILRWEPDSKDVEALSSNNEIEISVYILPKKYDLLKSQNQSFEKAIFSGFIGWFSVLLLKLMNIFYKFTGNYGVSIILLSIILKIVLYPLSIKQLISAKKMQKIQPLLNELKKKYKDDQKTFGIEQMKLMKEHKVNPFGGCLPMLVQLPIWWGLFIMLRNAYELKDAVFIWWLKDLSSPDPYKILPILMGISMYLQQKFSGMQMDKSSSSMMLLMPVMFTFISFSLPSGLVLYWLVTAIFGIIESKLIIKAIKI